MVLPKVLRVVACHQRRTLADRPANPGPLALHCTLRASSWPSLRLSLATNSNESQQAKRKVAHTSPMPLA